MNQLHYILRTLWRGHSALGVKLVSLTLGLGVGMLLFSLIVYHQRFDSFYPQADRLALLGMATVQKGQTPSDYNYATYKPAAADLWAAMPEYVACATTLCDMWQPVFYHEDKKLAGIRVLCTDSLYFQTTGLTLLQGDAHDLGLMGTAFISEGKARELFGGESPIGRELSVEKLFNVTIRGVYADVPENTILPHDMLLSLAVIDWGFGVGSWGTNNIYYTLYRLHRAEDVEGMNNRVQQAVAQYYDTHYGDDVEEVYSVMPLREVHRSTPDCKRMMAILGVLGFSIFFVSVMNYVLGAVATISRRAKAVGVHKCCGAGSGHVLGMFMGETGLLVLAALSCSVLLMFMFQEPIEDLLGSRLADLFTWQTLYVPMGLIVVLLLLAGLLPGRIYARIPVTQVFRRYTDSKRGWKCGLLFVQFMGVAFICGLLLTTVWQYHSLMQRSVGFHSEGLAVGMIAGSLGRTEGVADAIRREPYVESVAASSQNLLNHYSTDRLTDNQGNFICPLHFMIIDKDFPHVTGMKLLEGSWPQHAGEAVVGRTTVETMKWGDSVLGRQLPVNPQWLGREDPAVIVGVVEDVRNMGFFMEQTCTAFVLGDRTRCFNVRLKAPVEDNLKKLNAFVRETYPQVSLEFTTYHDIRRGMNESVSHFRNIVMVTTACIVLIVLMGLIGYVSDETERRSKEIAIRKVNGATAADILCLLSIDILKVAVWTVLIGMAVSWYVSGLWMEQFVDSALLSPVWFVLVLVGLLALIVLVVMLKAWHIANENPVESIKSE